MVMVAVVWEESTSNFIWLIGVASSGGSGLDMMVMVLARR
jgi:hypothetical protein